MKNIKSLITVALAVVIISSCKKEDPTPTTTQPPAPSTASKTCRVKTMKSSMNSPNDSITFSPLGSASYEYNSAGRISKRTNYDSSGVLLTYILYDYSTNGIVDTKTFSATGTQKSHAIYKLGSNGYASCSIDGDNPKDTLSLYEYNSDGYQIKSTDKKNEWIQTYTITNGNITQSTGNMSGTTFTSTYEYTDKPDKRSSREDFLGKVSTNLPAKMTTTMSFGTNVLTYTGIISYSLNNEGYPLEIIMTTSASGISLISKTNYTYNCQ